MFRLGEKLAIFHDASRQFKFEKDFMRPMYGIDRMELALEQIKHGVDIDVFSEEQYETMRRAADVIKSEIKILEARNEAWGIIHADIQLGNIIMSNGEPSFIDFCFSGFGYYLFDLGSAATILESRLRKTFLAGYASKSTFSFDDTRYIECLIFADLFISYPLFLHDETNWGWIKDQAKTVCDTLCKDFLEGKEVFYSF